MINRLFAIILSFLLVVIRFTILFAPVVIVTIAACFAIAYFTKINITATVISSIIQIFIYLISMVVLLQLLLDYVFGFRVNRFTRGCTRLSKDKEFGFLEAVIEEAKKKYQFRSVKVYLQEDMEINAFAVGSFRKNVIVVNRALLHYFRALSHNNKEFLYAFEGLIGHEMSHLVNRDFLPRLIFGLADDSVSSLEKKVKMIGKIFAWTGNTAINTVGGALSLLFFPIRIFFLLFKLAFFLLIKVPFGLVLFIYSFFAKITCGILLKIYNVSMDILNRGVEYRCDKESGLAFGFDKIMLTLCFLKGRAYNSIFSTHPSTDSRIARISHLHKHDNGRKRVIVQANPGLLFGNIFSLILIIFVNFWALDSIIRSLESTKRDALEVYTVISSKTQAELNKLNKVKAIFHHVIH